MVSLTNPLTVPDSEFTIFHPFHLIQREPVSVKLHSSTSTPKMTTQRVVELYSTREHGPHTLTSSPDSSSSTPLNVVLSSSRWQRGKPVLLRPVMLITVSELSELPVSRDVWKPVKSSVVTLPRLMSRMLRYCLLMRRKLVLVMWSRKHLLLVLVFQQHRRIW